MITRQLDNAEDRFAAIADYRDTADSGATDAVFAHSNARRAAKSGSILGANSHSFQATRGHSQPSSVQLKGSVTDTGRRAAIQQRCLLTIRRPLPPVAPAHTPPRVNGSRNSTSADTPAVRAVCPDVQAPHRDAHPQAFAPRARLWCRRTGAGGGAGRRAGRPISITQSRTVPPLPLAGQCLDWLTAAFLASLRNPTSASGFPAVSARSAFPLRR